MDMVSLVPFSIQGLGLPSGGLGTPRERVPLCLAPLLGSGHAHVLCCVPGQVGRPGTVGLRRRDVEVSLRGMLVQTRCWKVGTNKILNGLLGSPVFERKHCHNLKFNRNFLEVTVSSRL